MKKIVITALSISIFFSYAMEKVPEVSCLGCETIISPQTITQVVPTRIQKHPQTNSSHSFDSLKKQSRFSTKSVKTRKVTHHLNIKGKKTTLEKPLSLSSHTEPITAFDPWNPRNRTSVSSNRTIIIEDQSGKRLSTFCGHTGKITTLAYDVGNSGCLAAGYDDGTVIIWNLSTGEKLSKLSGHGEGARIIKLGYHIDLPNLLASAADDGTCIIWNLEPLEDLLP